jgi:(R,R)-butanediol dehydrogenase/meso-butanediol dehydrogenase/diacetyl reductase
MDLRVEEIPDAPAPGPGQVRVRVEWAGICGTDREEWRSGPHSIQVGVPHPTTGRMAPIVIGHEVAGTVIDLGAGVSGLREGDLVALDGIIGCGRCHWCSVRKPQLCSQLASIGFHADGGLAELITVDARTAIRVPDGTPADTAALAEPVAVAVRALSRSRIAHGESVLVVGAGMIGLAALCVARRSGASAITVVTSPGPRADLARTLGADAIIDSGDADRATRILDAHGGLGPDLVIEAGGGVASTQLAIAAPRRGGRTVLVGLPVETVPFDVYGFVLGEREVIASLSHVWNEDFTRAVELLADGLLRADDVVSARIPFEETVARGFDTMGRSDLPGVKVLVGPHLRPGVTG